MIRQFEKYKTATVICDCAYLFFDVYIWGYT